MWFKSNPTWSGMCFHKSVYLVLWSCLTLELFLLFESPISLSPPECLCFMPEWMSTVLNVVCNTCAISNPWWETRAIKWQKSKYADFVLSGWECWVLIEHAVIETDSSLNYRGKFAIKMHKHLLNVARLHFSSPQILKAWRCLTMFPVFFLVEFWRFILDLANSSLTEKKMVTRCFQRFQPHFRGLPQQMELPSCPGDG